MALRLQLETGKTKKYDTYYMANRDEFKANLYETKCKNGECNHIDCAIEAAKNSYDENKADAKLLFAFGIFWLFFGQVAFKDLYFGLCMCGFLFLLAIWSLIISHIQLRNKKELIEYRDHGTIDGVAILASER